MAFNKKLPPLFVEADTFIKRHLYEGWDNLCKGKRPYGKALWELYYLYIRAKAVCISNQATSNAEDVNDMFAVIETHLLDHVRQNPSTKSLAAEGFNQAHRQMYPGMELRDHPTRHHGDFNDKDFNSNLGHQGEYKKAQKAAAEQKADVSYQNTEKAAPTQQETPKNAMSELTVLKGQVMLLERNLKALTEIVGEMHTRITSKGDEHSKIVEMAEQHADGKHESIPLETLQRLRDKSPQQVG